MGQACSNCKYKEKEGELKTGPSLHGLDQPNIGVDNAQGSVQITDNEPAAGSQQHNPKQDPSPVLQGDKYIYIYIYIYRCTGRVLIRPQRI